MAPAVRTCDENLQGGSSWETAFRVRTLWLLGSLCHSVHVQASTDTRLYTHTHSETVRCLWEPKGQLWRVIWLPEAAPNWDETQRIWAPNCSEQFSILLGTHVCPQGSVLS